MQINGSLYLASAPGNGNIRMKAYEVTTPGTPVATKDFANPSFPMDFSLTVPNDVVHNVQVYDSDLTTDGTLLASFVYDPKFSSVDIRGDLVLVVGNTDAPAAGETDFADADLKDFTYSIERRGIGTIIPDDEWEYLDDGGFKLITTGDQFGDGETFILHFYPKITTVTPSAGGGGTKFISGIATAITADKSLDDTYYNQLIPLNSATNKLAITLTKIADTPANTLFVFDSSMGGQNNSVINASGTDSILWNGEDRSAMYMGKNEQLWLMKGADGWHVLDDGRGFPTGAQFFSHKILPNTIELNGALLKRDEWPRLFYDYVNKLPAAMIVTEASWAASQNRGYFTLGDGSTTFRICDSRGLFTRNADSARGVDDNRAVGSYQADGIASWSIDVSIPKNNTSRSDSGYGRFTTGSDGNEPSDLTFTVAYVGATETRPKNEAKIALIAT